MMRDYHEQVIASLTSGVIALDWENTVITANAAACRHLGIASTDLGEGVNFGALEGVEHFREIVEELKRTGEPVSRRELELDVDDRTKHLGVTASLLDGPDPYNGVIFLFADLTALRALERSAELNRQLAQVGELTAGVVHELRNPIAVISGMAEMLKIKLADQEEHARRACVILEEVGQLEKLIRQFLSFAKPFEVKPEPCAPEAIITRVLAMCGNGAKGKGVHIETHPGPDAADFEADYDLVCQALANLVRNAIEVLDEGGRITLSSETLGDHVVFRVEDNGPGIHLAKGEDPFNAFFSKKEGGTGLGLSIVHRIVTAHGGTADYGNLPSRGAYFALRLPRTHPRASSDGEHDVA